MTEFPASGEGDSEQGIVKGGQSNSVGYLSGAPQAMIAKFTDLRFQKQVIWTIASIILAILVSAVIMAMAGYDAGQAFIYLLVGALREPDRVLQFATPLILTGLAVALAFKCGLFNIGAEGQLYIGSMAAAVVGFTVSWPYLAHPILCLLVAAICGGIYGLIPGLLLAYRGAHEVVTTMMLSYAAIALTSWLVGPNGFWMDTGGSELIPQTPLLQDTAILPTIGGPYLHWGIFVALLAVVVVDYLINRTVLGYEMRAVGLNKDAAEYAGINSKKNVALTLTLSGALAGLAGGSEVMGTYNRFIHRWSPGLGWDGITVAVLGGNNPWGVLGGAIFFAALRVGGNAMQSDAHVPIEMVSVIQGLIVLFVAAPRAIMWLQDRSVEYADWVKSEEKLPLDHLFGTISSLAGVFISFGLVSATLGSLLSSVSLLMVGVVSIAAFGIFLSKRRNTLSIFTVLSIAWLLAALVSFFTGIFLVTVIAGVMGFLSIIDLLLLRRRSQESTIVKEVEN
ncbi:MAG: ABC transporter permease [Candidatus Thorarchaeota archaeon]